MTVREVKNLITDNNSFLNQFFPHSVSSGQMPDCFDSQSRNNSFDLHEPDNFDITLPLLHTEHDFTFVKKFGKLAFKYSMAFHPCKTSQYEFISKFFDLLHSESPSKPVIEYSREVFRNNNRVKDYLEQNFCKFSFTALDVNENCKIFITDLKQVFKQYLGVQFISQFLFFNTEKKNYLENIFDGSAIHPVENTIFISLYYDDFNPLLNSLSSNATRYKCSAVYLKILNISPLLASKRACVMPFAVFYSKNFASEKSKIFIKLKENLNLILSDSLTVNDKTYHFKLVGCSCDNLGAHELLGMSNFSAKHCCRFCKMSFEERQELYRPNKLLKRTKKSLKIDHEVFKNLKGGVSHVYGVKENNLLYNIVDYSPEPETLFSCISHDLFEKVIPDVITTVITKMHRDKLLNQDEIYSALNSFPYNAKDKQNPINYSGNLSCLSASQGRTFCKVFLFVLKGKLPYNSPLFDAFILLTSIVDMVYSPFFYKSWFPSLESNIEKLLHFVRTVLNLDIYPKLHFLIHYPDLIRKYGPLRSLSTDQFESAHRFFKEQLITSSCHKNIIKTMFKRALYKFSYMYSDDYNSDCCSNETPLKGPPEDEILYFCTIKFPGRNIKFMKKYKYFGFTYEKGMFFAESKENNCFFSEIISIFLVSKNCHFICSTCRFTYEKNIHAYKLTSR